MLVLLSISIWSNRIVGHIPGFDLLENVVLARAYFTGLSCYSVFLLMLAGL